MEANELMIGDLVFVHKPTCKGHRVDYINEMDEEIGADGEIYNVCDVEPIPLTPEILEKNGFKVYEQDFTSNTVYKFGCFDFMEFDRFYKCFNIGSKTTYRSCGIEVTYIHSLMQIYFVHQLQHALRLCGIKKEIEL